MKKSTSAMFAMMILSLGLIGCGSGGPPPRPEGSQLTGVVTWEGKPLKSGEIEFLPDTGMDNQGPSSMALIVDGKYETKPGRGLLPGHTNVRVTIHGETIEAGPDVPPEEIGVADSIGVALARIQVAEGGGVHDFDFTKKDLRQEGDN